jgi:hypothetical protein
MNEALPSGSKRSWIISLSSVFALSATISLVAVGIGPGCQTRCFNKFDCGDGSYCSPLGRCETECFTDLDCRQPPECAGAPSQCPPPRGFRCDANGRCIGSYDIPRSGTMRKPSEQDYSGPVEGWDEFPGSGTSFIVNQIAIAGQDRGFDVDQSCDGASCIDNVLWQLGELGNDQIRQGLLGGESLLLIELAGLDVPYDGDDRSLTVKIYGARDADDPFFPANNFKVPPGHQTCCEFLINPQSITTDIPAKARARAPAKLERGRLASLQPVPIQFTLTVGAPPHPEIRLERVLISGRVPSSLREFSEGLLGGAVPIQTLAQTENPYCKTVSPRCTVQFTDSTLIDLVATLLRPEPDIDLDVPPDGIECVIDTDGDGRIDRCCDGNGAAACHNGVECGNPPPISPERAGEPSSCALSSQMADGYSVAITFTAVGAKVVGFGQ